MDPKTSCNFLHFSSCQDDGSRVFPRWFSGKSRCKHNVNQIIHEKHSIFRKAYLTLFVSCFMLGIGWCRFYFWRTNSRENGGPHLGSSQMANAFNHTLFFHLLLLQIFVPTSRPTIVAVSQSSSYWNHIQISKWYPEKKHSQKRIVNMPLALGSSISSDSTNKSLLRFQRSRYWSSGLLLLLHQRFFTLLTNYYPCNIRSSEKQYLAVHM